MLAANKSFRAAMAGFGLAQLTFTMRNPVQPGADDGRLSTIAGSFEPSS